MKKSSIIFSVIVMSMLLCSASFAQEIPVYTNLDPSVPVDEVSDVARTKFAEMKLEIEPLVTVLPKIDDYLSLIEDKLNDLVTINVYYTGDPYDDVHFYYINKGLALDDVETAELETFLNQKQQQAEDAVTGSGLSLPANPLPPETITFLTNLKNEGELKATRGKQGKSRISILSAYVNPRDLHTVKNGTMIVIAIFTTDQDQ